MINIDMYRVEKEKMYFLFNAILGGTIWGGIILGTIGSYLNLSPIHFLYKTFTYWVFAPIWFMVITLMIFFWIIGENIRTKTFGNAVTVGENQYPELHKIVVEISRQLGMVDVPAICLIDNHIYQNYKNRVYLIFNAILGGLLGILIVIGIIFYFLYGFVYVSKYYPYQHQVPELIIGYLNQWFIVFIIVVIWSIALIGELKEFPFRFAEQFSVLLHSEKIDSILKRKATKELKMIIGRELARHAAGHTSILKNFILEPALLLPIWGSFAGKAYRRACELTADRIGMVLAGDVGASTKALINLTGGSEVLAPKTNVTSFMNQEMEFSSISAFINEVSSSQPRMTYRVISLESFARVVGIPTLPEVTGTWLIYGVTGPLIGTSVEIGSDPIIIGRDPKEANLIVPSDSGRISRRHCRLRVDDSQGVVFIEDTNSKNGTFINNGSKVSPGTKIPLSPGDRFYLAEPEIMFEIRRKES